MTQEEIIAMAEEAGMEEAVDGLFYATSDSLQRFAAIIAGVGAAPAAPDVAAELEEVKTVCAEAYQVVGALLADAGRFDSPDGQKILDNLAEQRLRHTDVLPWASKAAPEGWQLVQSTGSTQRCWCAACDKAAHHGMRTHMSVCPQCGSKRCEKALNHQAECSSAPKP